MACIGYNNACIVGYMPIVFPQMYAYFHKCCHVHNRTALNQMLFVLVNTQWAVYACVWCWYVSIKTHWDTMRLLNTYIHASMQYIHTHTTIIRFFHCKNIFVHWKRTKIIFMNIIIQRTWPVEKFSFNLICTKIILHKNFAQIFTRRKRELQYRSGLMVANILWLGD